MASRRRRVCSRVAIRIYDFRRPFRESSVVDLRIEALKAIWVFRVCSGFDVVAFGELQAAAAADLVDAFLGKVSFWTSDEASRLMITSTVAVGVEEDIGRAVVVHSAVDEVDAGGVLEARRAAFAGWDGA